MSVLKRIGILLLALVVGGVLGFGLAFLFENGWLEGWERVAATPEPIAQVRLIDRDEVWVETTSGALYHNAAADTCQADCWVSVSEIPAAPAGNPEVRQVLAEPCVTPPPLLGVVERKAECQREDWVDFNTVYARQGSGDLLVWRFTSGGEYMFLMYLLGVIFGAVVLFSLVLVSLAVEGLWRWNARRASVRPPN